MIRRLLKWFGFGSEIEFGTKEDLPLNARIAKFNGICGICEKLIYKNIVCAMCYDYICKECMIIVYCEECHQAGFEEFVAAEDRLMEECDRQISEAYSKWINKCKQIKGDKFRRTLRRPNANSTS